MLTTSVRHLDRSLTFICRIFAVIALLVSTAYAQDKPFNRYTDELPKLLESDAVAVMVRGVTHEFASTICARLDSPTGKAVEKEVAAWRKKNDPFFRAAASALNEFGDRHLKAEGEKSRQGYMHAVLRTTAAQANQRVTRQLNGANLENYLVPPEQACSGLANLLRDGVADFERTPDVTRALIPYMQRKGLN